MASVKTEENSVTVPQPTSAHATVSQQNVDKLPKVSPGVLTLEVLTEVQYCIENYGMLEGIDMDKNGGKYAAICFQDPSIRNWLNVDRERLGEMGLSEFMEELKEAFLGSDWQEDIEREVYASQQGARPFLEWVTHIEAKNSQLPFTSQLSYQRLCLELPSRLNDTLFRALKADPYADKVCTKSAEHRINFRAWATHVKTLEDLVNARKAETTALVAEMLKAERSKTAKAVPKSQANPSRFSSSSNRAGSFHRLTKEEMDILNRHHGCYRCRRFNAGHSARNCPNAASSAPVTEEAAQRARPRAFVASPASKDTQGPANALKSSHGSSESAPRITASQDNTQSQDEPENTEYVRLNKPCLSPSLLLKSASNRTILAETLIDHGCSTVLIKAAVADKLGLVRNRMARVENLVTAENNTFSVSEWVSFRIATPDNVWTSKVVYAKVAASLCCEVILGMPFLARNRVVVDARARTVVTSDGIDLMAQFGPLPEHTSAHSHRPKVRCKSQAIPIASEGHRPELSPVATASHVRRAIEHIAAIASLERNEEDMRSRYADRFPTELPHVDSLPTEPVHRIILKDVGKGFKSRQYPCPQKYRDAWRTLIDEHLKAGRIRVSSSPYSSPAFLIPKADPNTLPRWVNNYRLLKTTLSNIGHLYHPSMRS